MKWLIVLLAVVGILAVTNPSRDEFNDWAARYAAAKIEKEARKEGREPTSGERLIGGALVGVVVSNMPVKRQNFVVFSIYSLDQAQVQGEGYPGCAVGIAGNFVGFEDCT